MRTTAILAILTLAALAAWWFTPAPARAQEAVGEMEISPDADKAIQRGLSFLASRQNLDGSWDTEYRRNTGVMSVALLAFLASGNLPGQGEYGVACAKGLTYIMSCAKPNGMITQDPSHGPMYEHALSTLFLAEVWGQTRQTAIKDKLKRAVELIISAQVRSGPSEGVWGYQPLPAGGDISVTVMQVMALRAAHDAGIEVPKETIERAMKFVNHCHNADGGYSYQGPPGPSGVARSAAGVCCLQFAGNYTAVQVKDGLDYLLKNAGKDQDNYFYANYYGVHAFYFAGGEFWKQWYPKMRDELLAKQSKDDGSWNGRILDTGWAVMCLSMPHRFLPIYQR